MTSFLPECNYSVIASWKYKDDDGSSFCNAAKPLADDFLKYNSCMRVFAHFNHITFSTPFEYFKFVCPNAYMDGEFMRANFTTHDYLFYYKSNDFYDGWMREFLCMTMRFLADGSRVDVVTDDSKYSLVVENGEVKEIRKGVETS